MAPVPANDDPRGTMSIRFPILATSLLAAVLPAQDRQPTSTQTARWTRPADAKHFGRVRVPGEQVAHNVDKLRELRWHGSLGSALQSGKTKDRPVVWIQALGDLDGFL